MLVRIKGKTLNNTIQFQIPSLYFENTSYVSLQHILIEFKSTHKALTGHLSTTLIDRNPFNPEQVLADFQQSTETKTLFYQPPHLQYYKIQRMDLTSSEFNLSFRENIKIEEIIKIDILLHIFDARIQPRFEQSIH